jgi:hypothetical protein
MRVLKSLSVFEIFVFERIQTVIWPCGGDLGRFRGNLRQSARSFRYWGEICQTVCKPGSVPTNAKALIGDGYSSGTPVAERLARPTRAAARKLACGPKPDMPPLFGLAPSGVCPATTVTGGAVRSYRTLSPLPHCAPGVTGCIGRRFAFCGTFPGVTPAGRYPAPCSRGARTFLPSQVSHA